MAARDALFNTLYTIDQLLLERFIQDLTVISSVDNDKARVLRNGLSISLFNMLEHFLKQRYLEISLQLSGAQILFDDFPDKLRRVLTIRALSGLVSYINRSSPAERINIFKSHVRVMSSTFSAVPEFSYLGFGYEKSNISQQDIVELVSALGISEVWDTMAEISGQVGLARPALKSDFEELGRARHEAAHNALANIPSQDLLLNFYIVKAVALSFDALLSQAARAYCELSNWTAIGAILSAPKLRFRFLDIQANGACKERRGTSTKYLKSYRNLKVGKAALVSRARKHLEMVVVRSESLIPVEWFD